MSTTVPNAVVQDTLSNLLQQLVEIKDTLRQIAGSVQQMSNVSD